MSKLNQNFQFSTVKAQINKNIYTKLTEEEFKTMVTSVTVD